jgi:cobalt/nickel transport system permease protein
MSIFPLVWAVHIADGVLGWPWLAAGFALAALLALLASWRVREEEVPRIALMTAAFFVASSIHVKLGPSSAHLLLGGLVGVVLGRRAPLAILVGVTLQALLIPHGGMSTIGVNAVTQTLPALLAGALFPVLHALAHGRHPAFRALLVMASAVLWGSCLVFACALLLTNPWHDLLRWSDSAGVVVAVESLTPALNALRHPATLVGIAVFALACVQVERRLRSAPEFALGVFLGVLSVLATTLLAGLVLLADGADRWGTFVSAVFLAHLPIALLEGVILGCTVSFLARVKPEMLIQYGERRVTRGCQPPEEAVAEPVVSLRGLTPPARLPVLLFLSLAGLLLTAGPAWAHRLLAEYTVDRAKQQVRVESWYETDDPPTDATAKVLRADGSVLAEGPLDARGVFVFTYENAEPLLVKITAPGGHGKELRIRAGELKTASPGGEESDAPSHARMGPNGDRAEDRWRSLVAGVGFLLALGALVQGWLTGRRLRRLEERLVRSDEPSVR